MNDNITIRKITDSSETEVLVALLNLHRGLDLQEVEVAKLPKVNVLEGYQGWFDTIEKCFDDVDVLGAFIDGVLVGFISYRSHETYRGYVGALSYIFVNDQYRRMGVARKLWDSALEQFRNKAHHRYVTLDVYVTNQPAIDFYESIGFSPYIQSMAYKL